MAFGSARPVKTSGCCGPAGVPAGATVVLRGCAPIGERGAEELERLIAHGP